MSSFVLKIIALVTMFIDHLGYAVYGTSSFFNYIGRIAFPIFAFQISEGYTHTKDVPKYLTRLTIFALISQIPFYLFCSTFTTPGLNVFFTLVLGLIAIIAYDNIKNLFLRLISVLALCALAQVLHTDYGAFGVALIFMFYLFRKNKLATGLAFLAILLINYGQRIIEVYFEYGYQPRYNTLQFTYFIFTLLPIIPILLYNKKQGKKIKYLLYIFYPVHLLFLYGIIQFQQ